MHEKTTKNADGTVRSLSNRHVQMIAISGTIGTGLFLGSGSTISETGPSILLIYLIMGIVFFLMMRAIGEMFYTDPNQHTFVTFINRYLGHTIGTFTGWSYWLSLVFGSMAELTAIATYVNYWFPNIPAWIIEVVFLVALMMINLIAARLFGEAEFWFSMIKIIAIVALIVTGLIMAFTHVRTPLGHASLANLTNHFTLFPHGSFSFFAAFPMVFFAFQGIEFVSITLGESKNPRQVVKKSVNETLFRIMIFYIGALAVIMAVIPWTSITADKSPFVQVFALAGLPAAAAIINFVVLTSAASALNSIIFSAGRHLYQLADDSNSDGVISRSLTHVSKNGIPVGSIVVTSVLILIGPMISVAHSVDFMFTLVSGATSDMSVIVYLLTMFAHRKYRQSSDFLDQGFKMPGYAFTSPLTIAAFIFIFASLLIIPADAIGAISAVVWVVAYAIGVAVKRFTSRSYA
ncbi:Aromatic amino acid transport protein [Apilactobacillus kunkeei]|uniref:Aromatic amino acid transport protein n=1 Tax=Apilactobacillus kunkeei TaxID=148814 RepID=A0A0M9DCG2_9LACO|nr:amino acid permease [Apilactobacillus kunkeei]KOY75972.1 Aromatic amino acid transport protein [Apilactobacillus kunkeei]